MTREYLEESHKLSGGYKTYLEERFQGEVYGEALFRTMAELSAEPAQAWKFRVLEQLERETKEFLLPAVRETGCSGEESPERISKGVARGTELAKAPWKDLMRGFQNELQRFVEDFKRAEAILQKAGAEEIRAIREAV